jgi:hypothetical protein
MSSWTTGCGLRENCRRSWDLSLPGAAPSPCVADSPRLVDQPSPHIWYMCEGIIEGLASSHLLAPRFV